MTNYCNYETSATKNKRRTNGREIMQEENDETEKTKSYFENTPKL